MKLLTHVLDIKTFVDTNLGMCEETEVRDVVATVVEDRRAAGCGPRAPVRPPPPSRSAASARAALRLCAWQAPWPLCSR
ncbi:unnamed protein product [Arctia plantaginis]|uniref:Uncharacterized protein n=1 Tax=Arctia plantaginis TaxID=874455 RepID=A0A8S1BMX3_ARCPL|nr:unnamed protein product [Arctia plantaginis]